MFCIYQQRVDLIIYCNQVSDVALGLLFCIYRNWITIQIWMYVFTGQVISFVIVKFCTYTQSPNYSNYSNYTNQHVIVYITTIHTVGLKTSSDQKNVFSFINYIPEFSIWSCSNWYNFCTCRLKSKTLHTVWQGMERDFPLWRMQQVLENLICLCWNPF